MTVRLSVTAEHDIRESGEVNAVIASLSSALWWREGDADLVAVSGGVGWTERVEAHITAGARGILVVEPVAVTAEQLARVQARCAVPVVIEWPYVVDPALAMVVPDPVVVVASGDLIECRMVVPVLHDWSAPWSGISLSRAVRWGRRSRRRGRWNGRSTATRFLRASPMGDGAY